MGKPIQSSASCLRFWPCLGGCARGGQPTDSGLWFIFGFPHSWRQELSGWRWLHLQESWGCGFMNTVYIHVRPPHQFLWKNHEAPSISLGSLPRSTRPGLPPRTGVTWGPTPRTGCIPVVPDFVPFGGVPDVKSRRAGCSGQRDPPLGMRVGDLCRPPSVPPHLCGPLGPVSSVCARAP